MFEVPEALRSLRSRDFRAFFRVQTISQIGTYMLSVDSSVEFSLDYMGFSTYRTGFRAQEGSLEFNPARPAAASVNASIPVASVDVTNDRLMSRLMDPDLLGGKEHPTISFKSTRVEAVDPAQWKVTGDLTIHGVARPVALDTRYLGQAKHPFSGKIAAAFRAETTIDRRVSGRTGADLPLDHGRPPGLTRDARAEKGEHV